MEREAADYFTVFKILTYDKTRKRAAPAKKKNHLFAGMVIWHILGDQIMKSVWQDAARHANSGQFMLRKISFDHGDE